MTELPRTSETKGFLASLYDFKFTSLITGRFIRFVYAVLVILASLGFVLFALAVLNNQGSRGAIVAILLVPAYLLYLIYLRMFVEFVIVFFQIGEDVRAVRLKLTGSAPSAILSSDGGLVEPATAVSPAASRDVFSGVQPLGTTPPGWYDAPGDPTRHRYWDGAAWTEHHSPKG